MYENIVKRTPIDTGRARSNWNVSTKNVDTSITDNTQRRVSYSEVPETDGDEDYFISNNLPYINKLEYGGYPKNSSTGKTVNGFSIQAPNGMVGVTVTEFERIFEESIRSGE